MELLKQKTMNIKDLGNYQQINENEDSPILVSPPQFFTYAWSNGVAYNPNSDLFPMPGDQVSMLEDALAFVVGEIIHKIYQENKTGCEVWWYLKGYDIEFAPYINDAGSTSTYWMYKLHVIRVTDTNSPAVSPSNV